MARLLALVIMVLSLVSCSFVEHSIKSTAQIRTLDSICSATYIHYNLILTANHCFDEEKGPSEDIVVSGQSAKILDWVRDSTDHILLVVDRRSNHFAPISIIEPAIADRIFYVGNAGGVPQSYREGYVSQNFGNVIFLDANGWKGDSGAGVFNSNGYIVGTINFVYGNLDEGYWLMGVTRFSFEGKDLKRLGYSCIQLPICVDK